MSEALAAEHRRALGAVNRLADRQLRQVFAAVNVQDAAVVRDALMEAVPVIADTYGDMSGALAADYYDNVRERAEVRGRYVAQPAPLPGSARYEALVRWGVDPLFTPDADRALAIVKIGGGLHRIVADVSRQTVTDAAIRDPQAEGWSRVTSTDSCNFCNMLRDRGGVYTESTVRFKSHDNCNCSAAPAFNLSRTVSTVPFVASKRNVTAADRARVREYLAANY